MQARDRTSDALGVKSSPDKPISPVWGREQMSLRHGIHESEEAVASILAVDDSASMRQMLTFTLKDLGEDVIEAMNGKDGQAP